MAYFTIKYFIKYFIIFYYIIFINIGKIIESSYKISFP